MKKFLLFLFVFFAFLYPIPYTLYPVHAAPTPCVPSDEFGPCPAGLDEFGQVVGNVITVAVFLGFTIMLVMLIWAGIKYLTSGGEPKAIQAAHYTVTWALLGIIFMIIGWLILQLIFGFTNIKVTEFNIRTLCGKAGIEFCKPGP